MAESLNVEQFQERILGHMLKTNRDARFYQFSSTDIAQIEERSDSKFATWEWDFGYSPKYQFCKSITFKSGRLDLHMNVEKGAIKGLKMVGDFTSLMDVSLLEQMLVGTIHDPETLRIRLSEIKVSDYISGLENEELLVGLFLRKASLKTPFRINNLIFKSCFQTDDFTLGEFPADHTLPVLNLLTNPWRSNYPALEKDSNIPSFILAGHACPFICA